MADFNEAFNATMGHEGGYVDDPTDSGGETYRGISRRFNPGWPGWKFIDVMKPNIDDDHLDKFVRKFYKMLYWDKNRLDEFDQKTANEMFDTGVNMGARKAAKFLQRALSALNRNGQLFPDLVDDGVIGNKTFSAMLRIAKEKDGDVLLKIMNVLQGMHYIDYMKKSPEQEKYARGWFKRVKL